MLSGIDEKHPGGPLATHVFPQAAKNWTKSDAEAHERFSRASHVTFNGPDKDGLVVAAWQGKELIGRIERQQNLDMGFRCEGGSLLLSLPVYAEASAGVFFNMFRESAIMPATDGSIIVKYDGTGIGLGFYMIPVAMKLETWALYPQTKPNRSNEESTE